MDDAEEHESRPAPKKGRLACDICRERKVRCDRDDPKCGRCARLGYECSYQGRKRHRAAQADLPRQVSELQNRLAQAEAMLQTSAGSAVATTAPLPDILPAQEIPIQSHADFPYDQGIDLLTNLTEDIPDFWSAVDSSLPSSSFQVCEASSMPTSLERNYLLSGINDSSFNERLYTVSSEVGMVSSNDLAMLHHTYFDVMYPVFPVISRAMFQRELAENSAAPQVQSLSYSIALAGAIISQRYGHLQAACYSNARKYVELCERDDDENHFMSANVFKALVFLVRYELTKKHFIRVWMTISRAITLAQILGLHQLDADDGSQTQAEAALNIQDPIAREEMRRTFWALYIFEGFASVRMGRSCTLEEDKLWIFLPCLGDINDDAFIPHPMPFLCEPAKLAALTQSNISSYASLAIMVRMARLCYEHIQAGMVSPGSDGAGFWDRHYRLVKTINDYTKIFQSHLEAGTVREDPIAFSLHLNLCGIHIELHEAAIRKVDEQELPKLVAAESRKCSTTAAFKILGAIRMNWPAQRSESDFFTLQSTFMCWPIFEALNALSRDIAHSDNTPISVLDSMRLLRAALDQVEDGDGYWHGQAAGAFAALAQGGTQLEVDSGGSSMGQGSVS